MAKQKSKVQDVMADVKTNARGKNRDPKSLMALSLKLGSARVKRQKLLSKSI